MQKSIKISKHKTSIYENNLLACNDPSYLAKWETLCLLKNGIIYFFVYYIPKLDHKGGCLMRRNDPGLKIFEPPNNNITTKWFFFEQRPTLLFYMKTTPWLDIIKRRFWIISPSLIPIFFLPLTLLLGPKIRSKSHKNVIITPRWFILKIFTICNYMASLEMLFSLAILFQVVNIVSCKKMSKFHSHQRLASG